MAYQSSRIIIVYRVSKSSQKGKKTPFFAYTNVLAAYLAIIMTYNMHLLNI